jgi:DNA repair protein RecO (recombination protein O)
MESTVQAIVLKRIDSGETDRRLTLLTREFGKVDAVAKGARKSASRLAGSSDPLSCSKMTFAAGKKNRFITQTQPLTSFRGLRADFDRLTFALALAELYAAVVPWEEEAPEVYDLLLTSLEAIERHPKPLAALAWAEVQFLQVAGFLPQFGTCVVTDSAIAEPAPFVSPQAGGYVSPEHAVRFSDRFRSRPEVLIGLSRLADADTPPSNLKFAEWCIIDLLPFLHHVAETALPANSAVVAELRVAAATA